jgi:hypothetical protein
MTLLAVTAEQKVFWEITLGMGLVVILVVIALLTLLTRLVRDIDVGVAELWTMAKRMAANTATTYQFGNSAAIFDEIREELEAHDELLTKR